MHPDLRGIEFDWFAVDIDGSIALFATAGEGAIPPAVIERYLEHSAISDSLPSPRVGSPGVWKDYADSGLYVFDWLIPGGPYERRESPTCKPSSELREKILALPGLPRFEGSFVGFSKVQPWR